MPPFSAMAPPVRILALETSSRVGSVALFEDGRIVASAVHTQPNRHAEYSLALIESALSDAGWGKTSIDRVAVGIGPGSFTGIRVGMALAQGIALGIDVPLVGVGSLRAMARAVPDDDPRPRAALLDARMEELFLAVYGAAGAELAAPAIVARDQVPALLESAYPDAVPIGEGALGLCPGALESGRTNLPHAALTAVIASRLAPEAAPPRPLYLRAVNAKPPILAPSPLSARD